MMKYIIFFCVLAMLWNSSQASFNNNVRVPRQAQQKNYQEPAANYRPLNQAPAGIQQLLQFQQARQPIVHLPAQAPPKLGAAPTLPQPTNQGQVSQYTPNVQYGQAPQQPTYKNQAAAIASQYSPQGQQPQGPPQYNPQYNPQQQQQQQQQQPQYPAALQYKPQYNQQQQPQYQG